MASLTFGDWLNLQFDRTRGVLARDIAESAGISPGYLSSLRKSRKENPSLDVAREIAGAFARARNLDDAATEELKRAAAEAAAVLGPPADAASGSGAPKPSRWHELLISFGKGW